MKMYIRKYDYIDPETFTPMFGIVLWIKDRWVLICILCCNTERKRNLIYDNFVKSGIHGLTTNILGVQLEPPNETDALVHANEWTITDEEIGDLLEDLNVLYS